jgi:tRNA dimethylallyltransferase
MFDSKKLFVIMGPTGIGKTKLLYEYLNNDHQHFEVISIDSRQIYKYMSIGTAAPEFIVKKKIPHHLVEFLEPNQIYSAGKFVKDAEKIIQILWEKNKIPILCGGTGFYFKAFYTGMFFIEEDEQKKQEVKKYLDSLSEEDRLNLLKKIDPESINTNTIGKGILHPNDNYRIYRSLELFYTTGKTLRMYYQQSLFKKKEWNYEGIFIIPDKEEWDKQLKIRSYKMIENGFIEEAVYIFKHYGNCPALKTPGYKETFELYQKWGEEIINKKELRKHIAEILYQSHKKYGKMQLKWFKKEKTLKHVSIKEAQKFIENILNKI